MNISFQKNGVKIVGSESCRLTDWDFDEKRQMRWMVYNRLSDEIAVTFLSYIIGVPVFTIQLPEKIASSRGKITTFSSKSCRRLRDLLLSVYIPNNQYLAITVTLPSCKLPFEIAFMFSLLTGWNLATFTRDYISSSDWRDLIQRFRNNLCRSNLSGVWRIELQKRQVPHLHIIGFGNDINAVSEYAKCWFDAVDFLKDFNGIPLTFSEGFLIYGFVCKFVKSENWFKYLASHTSKHKECQIGWQGRQWGVFNRSLLHFHKSENVRLTDKESVLITRILRRMTGFRGFNKDLIGSLQLFVKPAIIKRLLDFYSTSTPF